MLVKESDIKEFSFKGPLNRGIDNEVQYRTLVNKSIEQKNTTITLEICNIKQKQKREDMMSQSYANNTYRQPQYSTTRQPMMNQIYTSRAYHQPAQFGTSRVLPNSRVQYYSPHNMDTRAR